MLRNIRSSRFAFILMLMLSSSTLLAQQLLKSSNQPTTDSRTWKLGTEVDLLPYAMGAGPSSVTMVGAFVASPHEATRPASW